jgi:hypothetical protein
MNKINIETIPFKDLENILNTGFDSFKIEDSTEPVWMREDVFRRLLKTYPELDIQMSNYSYTEFYICYKKTWDYAGVKEYCNLNISIKFSISVKKTKNIQEVSKLRKKYLFTKSDRPIKFKEVSIGCGFRRSIWEDREDLSNLNIIPHPIWKMSHTDSEKFFNDTKFSNISEIVEAVPKYIPEYFPIDMTEPFFNDLTDFRNWTGLRKNIESIIPKELLDIYIGRKHSLLPDVYNYKEVYDKIIQIVLDKLLKIN